MLSKPCFRLTLCGVYFTCLLSSRVLAADLCLPLDEDHSLSVCQTLPLSSPIQTERKQAGVRFGATPSPSVGKKAASLLVPPTPQAALSFREERAERGSGKKRSMLVMEIRSLESLFRVTPKQTSDRPTILRRLAETYVELENAAFREKTEGEIALGLQKKGPKQKQNKLIQQSSHLMKGARNQAIKYYNVLKDEYPGYSRRDEVLYFLAYEYEQNSDFDAAQTNYVELIAKYPSSHYFKDAYLSVAEWWFSQAQKDPRQWKRAIEAYEHVLAFPPPDNKQYGYALYKVAYAFWNKGELDKALASFQRVLAYGAQYPVLPNAAKLAENARNDLVSVYALQGTPAGAYAFFRSVVRTSGLTPEKIWVFLDKLGQSYVDIGRFAEAIAVYQELRLRDRTSDQTCLYQTHLTEATINLNGNNKQAVQNALEMQHKVFLAFAREDHAAAAKSLCAYQTASLLSETAMNWHLEVVGNSKSKGTGDPKTAAFASDLYRKILDTWTSEAFQSFSFTKFAKRDQPTLYKIRYNLADLLYFQNDWAGCGPAFDQVVAADPQAKDAGEAAYAAVLCYQHVYDGAHPAGADRKGLSTNTDQDSVSPRTQRVVARQPFSALQQGMLKAFDRYLCYAKPGDAAKATQIAELKFARARIYFENRWWKEAALHFRDVATHHADQEVGIYAAQLFLESLNVLGREQIQAKNASTTSSDCAGEMEQGVDTFLNLYCSRARADQEQCFSMLQVKADLRRLAAQKLVEAADKGGEHALEQYEQAGNAYMSLYRTSCEAPLRKGNPTPVSHCDEIVYNAASAYQAGRLLLKAIDTRKLLLGTKSFVGSPLLAKSTYALGNNYQAIAVYEQAAEWYEKYQKIDPKGEHAKQALSDAVLLRLGLGEEAQALDNAARYTRAYGDSDPARSAAIAFAVASHYAAKAENGKDLALWDSVVMTLQRARSILKKAPLDVQMQVYALLGKSFTVQRDADRAKKAYANLRTLWTDSAAGVDAIYKAYPEEEKAQLDRRVGKSLDALGEAYFVLAEEERAKVDQLSFPEYRGSGTSEDVLKHVNGKVKTWIEKKVPAIEAAAAAYAKILSIVPAPPPQWVIAAGARVGLMWGKLVDDFRRAPIPNAWKNDAEIRGVYYDALDAKSEPLKKDKAKPAMQTCLSYSLKYQYFDRFSRSCEEWLGKNYAAEYHPVDELYALPTWLKETVAVPVNPMFQGASVSTGFSNHGSVVEKNTR